MRKILYPGSAYGQWSPSGKWNWGFVLPPLYLVVAMWLVFWVDARYSLQWHQWGVLPQQWSGLRGVLAAPLLHGSLKHLANNSLPILILGSVLHYFYPKIAFKVWLFVWIFSGLGIWFIGRESYHIGASSVIYGLAAFVFVSGVLRKHANLLALSLFVAFFYGGLVWGLLPIKEQVSWEGHLAGGVAGLVAAVIYRKVAPTVRLQPTKEEKRVQQQTEEEEIKRLEERWGEKYWLQHHSEPKSITFEYQYQSEKGEGNGGKSKPD